MPESSRSKVDFPAPLWPTSPTRSPSSSDIVISRNASITTTLDALRPIEPPRNDFLSERDLASKIGNSTHASCVSMCGPVGVTVVCLEVLPGARTGSAGSTGPAGARGQTALLAHLLELAAGGHLLSEQCGLNPVEQPFQPADQLRLGDPQLGVGWDGAFGERQGKAVEFFAEFRRQTFFEFSDAGGVDRAQPVTAGVVEGRRPHLFEEL